MSRRDPRVFSSTNVGYVQNSGNDYANFKPYTTLGSTANACENARQSTTNDASVGFQVDGHYTVTNN